MGGVLTDAAVAGESQGAAYRHAQAAASVVLSVTAAGHDFAIDAREIREIRGWAPPAPLPGAPPYVQGMCDLRGEMMLMVVLARRLGVGEAPTALPVTVVVEGREGLIGLVVDSVSDLHSISGAQMRAIPETGLTLPAELLRGVIEIDGRLLGLVAVDRIQPMGRTIEAPTAEPLMSVAID